MSMAAGVEEKLLLAPLSTVSDPTDIATQTARNGWERYKFGRLGSAKSLDAFDTCIRAQWMRENAPTRNPEYLESLIDPPC